METKTRGRKRVANAARRMRRYDLKTEGRQLTIAARHLRDYIPSRLPADSADIARDIITSAAYGTGGWQLAKLVERAPNRDNLSLADCERLNQVRAALEAQGYTYERLREMLLARQD